MMAIFEQWTLRATDGTGDLFYLRDDVIVSKDERFTPARYALSAFDMENETIFFCEVQTRQDWERNYRLVRVALKYEKSNRLRRLSQ